jgi:hypothetical protein
MRSVVAVFGVIALLSSGCCTCRYDSVAASHPAEPDDGGIPNTRRKIYTVLVNGEDIFGFADFTKVRDELTRSGFPMVYTGELFHAGPIERSVRDVHAREPDSRFVVVGFGYGASVADQLAARLVTNGIPVDAVIALSPLDRTSANTVAGFKRLKFLPNGSAVSTAESDPETTHIPAVNHLQLPTHPVVVAAILDEMKASAARVIMSDESPQYRPLLDDPAPIPAVVHGRPEPEGPLVRKQVPTGQLTGRTK